MYATDEEREQAATQIRERLDELPVGTSYYELNQARGEVLTDLELTIGERRERERQEEREREETTRQVHAALPHIDSYLQREYLFASIWERHETSQRIQPIIEAALSKELRLRPFDMDDVEIKGFIEDQVDEHMGETEPVGVDEDYGDGTDY